MKSQACRTVSLALVLFITVFFISGLRTVAQDAKRLSVTPETVAECGVELRCVVWRDERNGEPIGFYQCSDGTDGFLDPGVHVCDAVGTEVHYGSFD